MDLVPHLFRSEFSKLVAVITKSFGLQHIELAEDIASETFLAALDTWPYKGVPPNPTAWLYTVARNKAKNHLARQKTFAAKVAACIPQNEEGTETELDFSAENIADSQLQMLFAVCHPSISTAVQIGLALRVLCGFGLEEIAAAFLTNKETIHKRLQRARAKLKAAKMQPAMPGTEAISSRLDAVLHTIYLLFSEGYYSESNNAIIRPELCTEALNLAYLLLSNRATNTHAANALMALMCFQASRLEARKSETGHIILYNDQDRTLWDTGFVEKGFYYLQQASKWNITSKYYIEASIAYWHTVDNDHAHKWTNILRLYDALIHTSGSPVVALNRLWAYAKVHGAAAAIEAAAQMELPHNHFYYLLLAELYTTIHPARSHHHYTKAMALCKTNREQDLIRQKIAALQCSLRQN